MAKLTPRNHDLTKYKKEKARELLGNTKSRPKKQGGGGMEVPFYAKPASLQNLEISDLRAALPGGSRRFQAGQPTVTDMVNKSLSDAGLSDQQSQQQPQQAKGGRVKGRLRFDD
jgi:hypothetical protein